MGIKNLKNIIKKHAPEAFSVINLNQLHNTKICIDSSILLYQFRYSNKDDNFHIVGFLNKIIELLHFGITPIFVFDGKAPDAKGDILNKRIENRNKSKERLNILNILKNNLEVKVNINIDEYINDSDTDEPIDTEYEQLRSINKEIEKIQKNTLCINKTHSLEVIELLKSIGIPFFESIGEAEESCAFLQKNNYANYILTEDTDSLTFGGSNIIFRSKSGLLLCNLPLILKGLGLNFLEFIDLCILCGCDYTCTIPKIGQVGALNIIKKYKSIENFITHNTTYVIPKEFDYLTARKLFVQNNNFKLPTEEFKLGTLNINALSGILLKYHLNIEIINNLINLLF